MPSRVRGVTPIELSGQERIELVYEEAKELVRLGLDINVAFMSDLSCVSDFNPDKGNLATLSALVGRPVERHEYIVDLAEEYSPVYAQQFTHH